MSVITLLTEEKRGHLDRRSRVAAFGCCFMCECSRYAVAGYTGYAEHCEIRGYIPHIRPRGEERKEIEINPDFKPRRWVVEVLHSWTNRFRKLLVRFEKKVDNHIALLAFAFATIVWRKMIFVHNGIIVG